MAKVDFKLNRKAVTELLRSSDVQAELRRRAEAVAAAAGPGHRVEVERGRTRARAVVITDDRRARLAEAKSRNLTRALNAARG